MDMKLTKDLMQLTGELAHLAGAITIYVVKASMPGSNLEVDVLRAKVFEVVSITKKLLRLLDQAEE